MDARKESGRPAIPTPTALSKVRNTRCIGKAATSQAAADALVGNTMRSLRRFADLRVHDARPARCLAELAKATDALSSAVWAVEYASSTRIAEHSRLQGGAK